MTSGGVGDCDIYIKKDTIPSKSNYLARSINDGNQEQITLSGLTPGYYYIMVHAFEEFSGVTFEAKFTQ